MTPGHGTASVEVPSLVRIKPGALERLGIYISRLCYFTVLSTRDVRPELERLLDDDRHLVRCVTAAARG